MSNNIVPTTSASPPLTYAQANSIFISQSNLSSALSKISSIILLNTTLSVQGNIILPAGNYVGAASSNSLQFSTGGVNQFNASKMIVINDSTATGSQILRFISNSTNYGEFGHTVANGLYIKDNTNSKFLIKGYNGTCQSQNNTLDDGSGNMSVTSLTTPSLRINNISIDQIMIIGTNTYTFTQAIGSVAGANATVILPDTICNTFSSSILTYNVSTGAIINQTSKTLYLDVSFTLGIGPVGFPNGTVVLAYILSNANSGGLAVNIINSDGNCNDAIGGSQGIVVLGPGIGIQTSLNTTIIDPGSSGTQIFVRNSNSLYLNCLKIRYLSSA